MRISDWSSDVCSPDLRRFLLRGADVDLLADAPAVEERGGDGGEEPARHDIAKPAQAERGRPDIAAEPERRIKLRLRRADAGRGGRQRAFARPHVRPLGNGLGRDAGRDLLRTPGDRRERGKKRPYRFRRVADQTAARSEEHTSELPS